MFGGGPKHLRGDSGDQAAGDEALGMGAQVVADPGDHVALPGGQSLQAGSGHFFRGLLILADEALLASYFVKFGNCRARAQRADANTVWFQFFRESLGKQQIEGFGCSIGGHVGDGLKGGRRSNDQHVTTAAFDHAGNVEARQVNHSATIYLHHFQLPPHVGCGEFAVAAKAGVIDEHVDLDACLARELKNIFGGIRSREIRDEDFGANLMRGSEGSRQFLQTLAAAGGEYELCAAGRQLFRQSLADAGARASYQRPFSSPLCRARFCQLSYSPGDLRLVPRSRPPPEICVVTQVRLIPGLPEKTHFLPGAIRLRERDGLRA
jgi:hypothetical protein